MNDDIRNNPKIGDAMIEWSRQTGLMNWNRYAAVNDEFHALHMEDAVGRAMGNTSGAFGMGNLRYAYLVNAIFDWLGEAAELVELHCQYRAINEQGDVLTATGHISDIVQMQEGRLLQLELDVRNQDGRSTCPATAKVLLLS